MVASPPPPNTAPQSFKRIVVALDGSALAEVALHSAATIARAVHGQLLLVRAVLAQPDQPRPSTNTRAHALHEAQHYLTTLANRLTRDGLAVTIATPYGEAATQLLLTIRQQGGDLLVLTTHGLGGPGRWVYGSVVEAILAQALVPILLIPSWAPPHASELPTTRCRVLALLNGSPITAEILPGATSLATALSADLSLLYLLPIPDLASWPDTLPFRLVKAGIAQQAEQARGYLDQLAHQLRQQGVATQTDLHVGEPAALVTAAQTQEVTVIALTTHGQEGPDQDVLDAVANTILRHSDLPLLLMRPQFTQPTANAIELDGTAARTGRAVNLRLDRDDCILLRRALQTLEQTVPAEQTVLPARIRRLLAHLPLNH